jgi:uncharacterized membrane protein
MSFLTLGIFWMEQQALNRSNIRLTWIQLILLFAATLTHLSTNFLAEFTSYRTALTTYWLNIFALGLMLYVSWGYATRNHLVKVDLPSPIVAGISNRILIAQAIYACGAALCVFNTRWSLAVIVVIQLNYVFSPGFRDPSDQVEDARSVVFSLRLRAKHWPVNLLPTESRSNRYEN